MCIVPTRAHRAALAAPTSRTPALGIRATPCGVRRQSPDRQAGRRRRPGWGTSRGQHVSAKAVSRRPWRADALRRTTQGCFKVRRWWPRRTAVLSTPGVLVAA